VLYVGAVTSATRTHNTLPLISCHVAKLLPALEGVAGGGGHGCVSSQVQLVSVVAFARAGGYLGEFWL
jgi:hypothetical protein